MISIARRVCTNNVRSTRENNFEEVGLTVPLAGHLSSRTGFDAASGAERDGEFAIGYRAEASSDAF